MAQVYKMMLGTSGRQWEQLTVKEDGTMMLYFHGTDRSVTQQVAAVTEGEWKGWLKSEGGSLYPGIESGKWQAVDCPAESAEIAESAADAVAVVTNTDCTFERPRQSGKRLTPRGKKITTTDCADSTDNEPAPLIMNQAKPTPSPRRQRKPRKPLTAVESRNDDTEEPENDYAWLQSAGYLAAASVALLIIWQTGLILPLGLIGLATSGFLK